MYKSRLRTIWRPFWPGKPALKKRQCSLVPGGAGLTGWKVCPKPGNSCPVSGLFLNIAVANHIGTGRARRSARAALGLTHDGAHGVTRPTLAPINDCANVIVIRYITRPLPCITESFCFITKPFGHVTEPFYHVAKPFGHVMKPFPNITTPLGYITGPFCHLTKPFYHVTKPFRDMIKPLRHITGPFCYITKKFLYVIKRSLRMQAKLQT